MKYFERANDDNHITWYCLPIDFVPLGKGQWTDLSVTYYILMSVIAHFVNIYEQLCYVKARQRRSPCE